MEDVRALVLRAHEAFRTGELARLEQVLAPHCVLHQCGFLRPLTGEELRRFLRGGGQALSDRRMQVQSTVVEGNTVAIRWTTTGVHTGWLIPEAAGRAVSFDSMTFVQVEDGKIAEIWNIQDTSSLGMQLEAHSQDDPAGS